MGNVIETGVVPLQKTSSDYQKVNPLGKHSMGLEM